MANVARAALETDTRGVLPMIDVERLDVSEVGDVTVVRFRHPRITEDRGIEQMARELFYLVEAEGRMKLVLDFGSVDILSSAALGKLITLDKKARARGGELKLSSMGPTLAQIFAVTRLDRLFDIEKDEAGAISAFCGPVVTDLSSPAPFPAPSG